MPHQLQSDLIVANSKGELGEGWIEAVVLGGGLKVVVGVDAGNAGQGKNALLRQEVVELEFAELDVEPTAAGEIIESGKDGFKVESAGIVRGWQHVK